MTAAKLHASIPVLGAISLMFALPAVAGGIAVSENGQATFGMPLSVPPGISGMAPQLALSYASGGLNGPVGSGWSIQGISMVTRCSATKATDQKSRPVEFDGEDKLCLDGQRLIQTDAAGVAKSLALQVSDARGGTGTTAVREFRADVDTFMRVRAYGAADSTNVGKGPEYFLAWTKSGLVYEYKRRIMNTSSSAVAVWAVSRIRDVSNNYMDFLYWEPTQTSWGSAGVLGKEWHIQEIRYTGNTAVGQTPRQKVIFTYTARTDSPSSTAEDRSEAYQVGNKNVSIHRLSKISMYINTPNTAVGVEAGSVHVRSYFFTYINSAQTNASLLQSVKECVDTAGTRCLPAPKFEYNFATNGGDDIAQATDFNLSKHKLTTVDGKFGIMPGDFSSAGRTDILRWSTTGNNELWTSNGTTFTKNANFTTFDLLFDEPGCFYSTVVDANADGYADVLRVASSRSKNNDVCPGGADLPYATIFFNDRTGKLNPKKLMVGSTPLRIDKVQATIQPYCTVPGQTMAPGNCYNRSECLGGGGWTACTSSYAQTAGSSYYFLDVNADGRLDVVKSFSPPLAVGEASEEFTTPSCAGYTCTAIYTGDGTGNFTALATNLSGTYTYSDPGDGKEYNFPKHVTDVNGDGLGDITLEKTAFQSNGNGNFTTVAYINADCDNPMDFNADGKTDCLSTDKNTLSVSDGKAMRLVTNFNITDDMKSSSEDSVVGDFNGDGRQDIFNWHDTMTNNKLWFSNGDGTFRGPATDWGWLNTKFRSLDGRYNFVLGDFTGSGSQEILRLFAEADLPGAVVTNNLYTRTTPRPPDMLVKYTSPTGLVTRITHGTLVSGNRYTSDKNDSVNRAVYPLADLTVPFYVVQTLESDTGIGTTTTKTEYAYKGLKASHTGRGWVGFREISQQSPAPNGEALTVVTQYLQVHPYIGVAHNTSTFRKTLFGTGDMLSRTTNTYCDMTNNAFATATPTRPCPVTSLVAKPYVYKTVEEGWDLAKIALPTVTTVNAFNTMGDPTKITVTTQGMSLGATRTSTKVTDNTYFDDRTSGDLWILGRLETAKVTNTVPDLTGVVVPSAGTAPHARDRAGTTPIALVDYGFFCDGTEDKLFACNVPTNYGPTLIAEGWLDRGGNCYHKATGQTCTDATYANCLSKGTFCNGSLQRVEFLGECSTAPTPGWSAQPGGVYHRGTGTACEQGTDAPAKPATLFLTCSAPVTDTTTPIAATLTCSVGNSGDTKATGITYPVTNTALTSTTSGGPTICGANNDNCGSVVLRTGTAVGNYEGSFLARPASGTSSAAQPFDLNVKVAPAVPSLALINCATNNVRLPSRSTYTCDVRNNGTAAASGITYTLGSLTGPAGVTPSGPTTCAASTTCAKMTVTSGSAVGTYGGNVTARASTGTGDTDPFSLVLSAALTPATLTLTGCTEVNNTTTPNAASKTCTLGNSGQTAATGITYDDDNTSTAVSTFLPDGTSGSVTTCAAGATNCGRVRVTTPTGAGTYAGTLRATPSVGTAGSAGFSLVVRSSTTTVTATPSSVAFGSWPPDSESNVVDVTIRNTGSAATTVNWTVSQTSGTIGAGSFAATSGGTYCTAGATLQPNASCRIGVSYNTGCTRGPRNGSLNLTGNFTAFSVPLSGSTSSNCSSGNPY